MYEAGEFRLFSISHILGIVIFFIVAFILPFLSKKFLKKSTQNSLGILIGWLVCCSYLSWVLLELLGGSFNIKTHLPFHLCRIANMMLPILMITRNNILYQILFYWGLSGMFQALITPDIVNDFPHFHYFRFWIGHNGLIIALIYVTVIFKMKPTIKGIKTSFLALNIFFFITIIVNIVLDANYFWICEKPSSKSLLDFLGPWPWYILGAEFIALIHFFLAYYFYIIMCRIDVYKRLFKF